MELSFTKMNGAGNDFVMLDNRARSLTLTADQIARLCDRHRGIGADGLLLVEPAENGADFRMRYYNADGGEAEMCGNGARCFARFARRVSGSDAERITFETPAGTIAAKFVGDEIQINLSNPRSYAAPVGLIADDCQLEVHFIDTGVPHAVVFVEYLEQTDVVRLGRALRRHPHFEPRGTNVNFAQIIGPDSIAIRTYERGVEDETLACGTGVAACALIHHIEHSAASPVSVKVRGGETLHVGFEPGDVRGEFHNVTLTGPADFVFDGTASL